jgi:hypothetical protein
MTKKPQIEKFKETAREVEAADNEAAFDAALKSIAEAQKDPNEDFGSEDWDKRHKRR